MSETFRCATSETRRLALEVGHAKLDTTALHTRVAVGTIRDVKSPLERQGVKLAGRSPLA